MLSANVWYCRENNELRERRNTLQNEKKEIWSQEDSVRRQVIRSVCYICSVCDAHIDHAAACGTDSYFVEY